MTSKARIEKAKLDFIKVIELYETAYRADCECGRDPEGCCPFCSKMERANGYMEKLSALLNLRDEE